MSKWYSLFLCAGVLAVSASSASAHTVQICWRAESNGTVTIFAGSYHGDPGVYGGVIVDGTQYIFTGSTGTLPSDITGCQATCPGGTPAAVKWQTTNISVPYGAHSVTTTATSAIEDPWPGCYPTTLEFGGAPTCDDADGDGVCDGDDDCPYDAENDADGDGICGDGDVCADTTLPEDVPTVRLGVNHFADTDGDGVFDTTSPNGVGPQRSYTIADTGGCSCEQIIDALDLGNGHKKFGCSIGVMDRWVAYLEANQLGPYRAGFAQTAPADLQGGGCSAGSGRSRLPAGLLLLGAVLLVVRRRRR